MISTLNIISIPEGPRGTAFSFAWRSIQAGDKVIVA